MSFGRYRLLSQLGAGRDGVRYRADGPDRRVDRRDRPARPSRGPTRPDGRRSAGGSGVAADDRPPVGRRVVELDLDGDPPFVGLEWVDGPTLAESGREEDPGRSPGRSSWPWPSRPAIGWAWPTAGRAGDDPAPEPGGPTLLDWTGLDVGPRGRAARPTELDESCRAPELAAGLRARRRRPTSSRSARILDWRLGRAVDRRGRAGDPEVGRLLRRDARRRPAARPTAARPWPIG